MNTKTIKLVLSNLSSKQNYQNPLVQESPLEPLKGRSDEMKKNDGGGFSFILSDEQYITRILILGTPTTYYSSCTKNTTNAITSIKKMVEEGKGELVLNILNDIYQNGRAAKQDPVLMVLAYLCRSEDAKLRRKAFDVVVSLRTLSQLFTFMDYYKSCGTTGGWGRMTKKAISNWITKFDAKSLSYQGYKYKSRNGWTLRDLLRCCHLNPKSVDVNMQLVIKTFVEQNFDALLSIDKPTESVDASIESSQYDQYIIDYLKCIGYLKSLTNDVFDTNKVVEMIQRFSIPREMLPTWALNYPDIWKALLLSKDKTVVTMPATALIRNLGNMTSKGVFDNPELILQVASKISNPYVINKSRIHPIAFISAYMTYISGKGVKGKLSWTPDSTISGALNDGFYKSFKFLKPTGKRIFHAFDGSGSMTCPLSFLPSMTSAQAVTILGMVFARTETSNTQTWAIFSSNNRRCYSTNNTGLTYFNLSGDMKLEDSVKAILLTNWGYTDCSLPIEDSILKFKASLGRLSVSERLEFKEALQNDNRDVLESFYKKIEYKGCYDAFIIYTDNDINAGKRHPSVALKDYRDITGIKSKFIVVSTVPNNYSIADPKDCGMLDVVGFDVNTPKIITEFLMDKL